MEKKEITANVGCYSRRDVTVYVIGRYYVQHGGTIVSYASDESDLFDGCYLDAIEDVDCFTWDDPIESLEELETAINS